MGTRHALWAVHSLRVAGCIVQYKDRVDMNLIKPAVDWRKTPVGSGTMGAAVAK